MQMYNDKKKSVNVKLFGDIYVSFGFTELIITERKFSYRSLFYQADYQGNRRMEILISFQTMLFYHFKS